ncbi:MAG: hypothetical protein J6T57_02290 [Alphaproteobacteria bacterium]|nr:hypothetical protein [Alphaproteobacteria bacterium]
MASNDQRHEQIFTEAMKKLRDKKLKAIMSQSGGPAKQFAGFCAGTFVPFAVYFLLGSLAWWASYEHKGMDDDTNFHFAADAENADLSWETPTHLIYGDMPYDHAIRNAYMWEDFRNGNGGLFQGICGLLSIAMSLFAGTYVARSVKQDQQGKAQEILDQLDSLKTYGIDAKKVLNNLKPEIEKLVSKMSELDPGYVENLLSGGMNNVSYETSVSIIGGFLKTHRDQYNRIVQIIDESMLPEEIVRKYGKGKTISFGAAQTMMERH